jgi:hypothetical protein
MVGLYGYSVGNCNIVSTQFAGDSGYGWGLVSSAISGYTPTFFAVFRWNSGKKGWLLLLLTSIWGTEPMGYARLRTLTFLALEMLSGVIFPIFCQFSELSRQTFLAHWENVRAHWENVH